MLSFANATFSAYSMEHMTLEEKVGQLFIVHFHGDSTNEDSKTLIHDVKVGGIIYYNWANGLTSPQQVQDLSFGLQELVRNTSAAIPLFIAVDQEGGIVSRLNKGFTVFPGNRALGETQDPDLAQAAAYAMGQELQAVGVNMNFAPVVDVNSNLKNPIIGIRAFSNKPEIVAAFGEKSLAGYKQAHIITSLKHFPGHGDVEIDSHEDLPVINKTLQELEHCELVPFAQLAPCADMIMTAHLLVPALDKERCSTVSEKTLSYLKNSLNFTGVIITDSLTMQGVLKKSTSIDEAAIQALNAGCDILLLGGKQLIGNTYLELTVEDIKRIHRSIVNAVKNNQVSQERLDQAVKKILTLKKRFLPTPASGARPDINGLVNTNQHQELAQKIASLSLQVISNNPVALSLLVQQKVALFAPQLLRETINKTAFHELGEIVECYFFNGLAPSSEEIEALHKNAQTADSIIICSYNSWKYSAQEALIQALLDLEKPTVLVATRDPLDSALFSKASLIINTFSPTVPSLQAVCNKIKELNSVQL